MMTLYTALDEYLASLLARAKRSSFRQAEVHARHLRRGLPDVPLAKLTLGQIDELIAARLREGVSRSSVNGTLTVLRAAVRRSGEPCVPVRLLRVGKKLPWAAGRDEVERLLTEAPDPDTRLALLLAARAGLRHQEILHLTWADVEGDVVRVRARGDWSPKSHHEREVPMHPDVRAALDEKTRDSEWLFPGQDGPKVTLRHGVVAAFRAAGLYEADHRPGLHSLRRTWATELLGAGVDVETVRQLGGWADLQVVQRYVTSTDERKRAAIAALGG